MNRLALRPFTFSNGVTIPAGTLIAVPSGAIHKDGEIYPNPEEFDGFRFVKLRELNEDNMARHQAFSTSTDHLSFGYGRHAWYAFCFVFALTSLIFLYQPWSRLRGQRDEGFTCTHGCDV